MKKKKTWLLVALAFIVVLAAAAILVAMITGPIGKDDVSIGASVCACLIAAAVLWRTIRAFHTADKP